MRMRSVSDCLRTTHNRRSAGACLSAATLARTTRRVAGRATVAARSVLKSDNLYPTPGLSRIGWISVLIDPQHLLTPFLDRAASQEQKQFEFTFAAIAQNLRR